MIDKTIYFDESGFTGYNLLDPNQPVFSVASTSISEDLAEDILRSSFPRFRGDEFHFSQIWRSRNKSGFREFCSRLKEISEDCYCYFANKRFALFGKIIDHLVEPHITSAGYDFYDDGFCWKFANFANFGIREFGTPGLMDELLSEYYAFSNNPSGDSLRRLQLKLADWAENAEPTCKMFLEQISLGAQDFERFNDLETFRRTNGLQTSTMIAVIAQWRKRHAEDFRVVHDVSSSFLRDREAWDAITGLDVEARPVRGGDGSVVEWPLRVVSTEARDSRDSRSIQFCDLLAGLTAKQFDPNLSQDNRTFIDELIDDGFGHIRGNGLLPGFEFPDNIPPKELEGPDVIDTVIGIMRDGRG